MKLILKFLSIFILSISSSFAYENYNECRQFKEKIQATAINNELDNSPIRSEKKFGINLEFQSEGYIYIQQIHPQTFTDYEDDEDFNTSNVESNYLSELNGIEVSKITEDDFKKELEKDEISFKTETNEKLYKLSKKNFEKVEIYITPNINNISKIDSKSSTFEANFEIKTSWYDDRFSKIAEDVYIEGNQKRRSKPKNKKEDDYSYFCILDKSFFKSINYPIPDVTPMRFTNNVTLGDKVKYNYF